MLPLMCCFLLLRSRTMTDVAVPVPDCRHHVGDPLPSILALAELGQLLGLSQSRVWRLYHAGDFNFALLEPIVGNVPRFSGRKLQTWLDGDQTRATSAAAPRLVHRRRG